MNTQINVAPFCQTHRYLLVKQLGFGPADHWQAMEIAASIAMFQGMTADPKVHAELQGDVTRLPALGCMACRKPDLFGTLVNEGQQVEKDDVIGCFKRLGEHWISEASRET